MTTSTTEENLKLFEAAIHTNRVLPLRVRGLPGQFSGLVQDHEVHEKAVTKVEFRNGWAGFTAGDDVYRTETFEDYAAICGQLKHVATAQRELDKALDEQKSTETIGTELGKKNAKKAVDVAKQNLADMSLRALSAPNFMIPVRLPFVFN